jgi:hypothetical protein
MVIMQVGALWRSAGRPGTVWLLYLASVLLAAQGSKATPVNAALARPLTEPQDRRCVTRVR